MSTPERRRFVRQPYFCEARLEGLDVARVPCRLADISVGGVFVEARTLLPVGARTRLRFHLGNREVATTAEVRYTSPGIGMGLRFLDLQPADRASILAFVIGQTVARPRVA